jgi:glutathione S-transferase
MSTTTEQTDSIRMVHIPRFRSTRPVWMYHELKQIYGNSLPNMDITTFDDIPAFRASKPQWLLDMNPNGKVPTMAHGPIVMFEGGGICSYFLDRFDVERKLLPRDPASVAMYYQLVSWCASTLDNLIATSSPINIVLDKATAARPMDDVTVNQKYFDEIFAPYITKHLKTVGGPYICGAEFTAADVILGFFVLLAREKMVPTWIEETKYPELFQYVTLIRDRPALQLAITNPHV